MTSQLSLLNMPDIVMRLILEKSDFISLLHLRKTCQQLRHFIDTVKPEPVVKSLDLEIGATFKSLVENPEAISFSLDWNCNGITSRNPFRVTYSQLGSGCLIERGLNEKISKFIEKSNYLDIALMDIQLILKISGGFEILTISKLRSDQDDKISKICSNSQEVLKSREHLLKVKDLKMNVRTVEHILSWLPYTDARTLESLEFRGSIKEPFDLRNVMKLEQWKAAKRLFVTVLDLNFDIESLLHFERMTMKIGELSWELAVELKEAFLSHPHITRFNIGYKSCNALEHFKKSYGAPFPGRWEEWYFGVPVDKGKVILVDFRNGFVIFERIDRNKVPDGANIL